MSGPTTEAVNEDVKELRKDLHEVQVSLTGSIHEVDTKIEKLSSEFNFAKWLIGLLLVTAVAGVVSGVWWAASINANVGELKVRIDRIEASLAKILEQTKPKAP
jgi:hypothetical protein